MGDVSLPGLDGGNPLAFFAALGALRTLSDADPESRVTLRWEQRSCWTPVLGVPDTMDASKVIRLLAGSLCEATPTSKATRTRGADPAKELSKTKRATAAALKAATKEAEAEADRRGLKKKGERAAFVAEATAGQKAASEQANAAARASLETDRLPHFSLDDVIGVPVNVFREFAARSFTRGLRPDRGWSDFVAAYGSDAVLEKDKIQPALLSFLNGAGGKCLLKTCRELAARTTEAHLERSLLAPWTYQDEQLALRWDPVDDRRYALRWSDPGKDTACTEWGASRLAVEALPYFTTAPNRGRLVAVGWRRGEDFEFTWPLWTPAVPHDVVRSLLSLPDLQVARPDRRLLSRMGIDEVMRTRRMVVNKNVFFSPARPVVSVVP